MGSKQVIVMKKFPKDRNMRTGKYIAQGAHASVGALFSLGGVNLINKTFVIKMDDPFVYEWIMGNFKKVTCYVETDQALIDMYDAAKKTGLACSLIKDAGLTEFNGVHTLTAIGIGPGDEDAINRITGNLPLF